MIFELSPNRNRAGSRFQLKWQEPIDLDEAERRSRASRLRAEVLKWIAAVQELTRTRGVGHLASQLGFGQKPPQRRRGRPSVVRAPSRTVQRLFYRSSGLRYRELVGIPAGPRGDRPWPDTFQDLFSRFKAEETRPVGSPDKNSPSSPWRASTWRQSISWLAMPPAKVRGLMTDGGQWPSNPNRGCATTTDGCRTSLVSGTFPFGRILSVERHPWRAADFCSDPREGAS